VDAEQGAARYRARVVHENVELARPFGERLGRPGRGEVDRFGGVGKIGRRVAGGDAHHGAFGCEGLGAGAADAPGASGHEHVLPFEVQVHNRPRIMPTVTAKDGVRLYYEEAGSGTPLVFVHEFAGDYRSWEPQVRYFSRRYRCIAYNARGYPPSDVPEDGERYSQAHARDDVRAVLDGLGIQRAHGVGLSMGSFGTLHFGFSYPERALSLVVAGGGSGAPPAYHKPFADDARRNAEFIRREGMERFAATYGHGPTRVQLQNKDPRGFAEFIRHLSEHSALGSANTMQGYQGRRPSLYDFTAEMARLAVPTLLLTGDEDEPCL